MVPAAWMGGAVSGAHDCGGEAQEDLNQSRPGKTELLIDA
jgi:predicted heme/steroid binding protein